MKRLMYLIVATAFVGSLAGMAQPPGGPGGRPPGPDGQPGGQHSGPPPNPVLEVLDSDGNHEISAREIQTAAVSLRKLDRNRNGRLTADELHPAGGPGQGAGNPDSDGRRGRGGGQGGAQGPGGPPTPEKFVSHAMTFDADKDGLLNKAEIEKMATALVAEMARRGGGPGQGPGGGGGGQLRQRPEIE